jgi:hypothetical protein
LIREKKIKTTTEDRMTAKVCEKVELVKFEALNAWSFCSFGA